MTGYPVQTVNNDEDENDDDGDDVEERRDRGYVKHRYQADVTRVARDLATFRLATQTPYNAFPSEWNRVVSPELDDTQGNKSPQIWCLVTILSEGFRSEIYHHSCTFTLSFFFFFFCFRLETSLLDERRQSTGSLIMVRTKWIREIFARILIFR